MTDFEQMFTYIKRCYEEGRVPTNANITTALYLIMEKIDASEKEKTTKQKDSFEEAFKQTFEYFNNYLYVGSPNQGKDKV